MKQIITAALASAALFMPAMAQPEVPPFSMAAMGCMKLLECTEGVYELTSVDQLKELLENPDFENHRKEIESLLASLNKVGVKVYVAEAKNFPRTHRGSYYTDTNSFFLNMAYVHETDVFMKVMRHEGWHAAQDCMAGTIDNSMIAVVYDDHQVPPQWILSAKSRYRGDWARAVPWEQEAIWAGNTPGMTEDALAACASDTPMWHTYTPTPKTAEWLRENGYNVL